MKKNHTKPSLSVKEVSLIIGDFTKNNFSLFIYNYPAADSKTRFIV